MSPDRLPLLRGLPPARLGQGRRDLGGSLDARGEWTVYHRQYRRDLALEARQNYMRTLYLLAYMLSLDDSATSWEKLVAIYEAQKSQSAL